MPNEPTKRNTLFRCTTVCWLRAFEDQQSGARYGKASLTGSLVETRRSKSRNSGLFALDPESPDPRLNNSERLVMGKHLVCKASQSLALKALCNHYPRPEVLVAFYCTGCIRMKEGGGVRESRRFVVV